MRRRLFLKSVAGAVPAAPALREKGFSQTEMERLTVRNPQEAFSVEAQPAG